MNKKMWCGIGFLVTGITPLTAVIYNAKTPIAQKSIGNIKPAKSVEDYLDKLNKYYQTTEKNLKFEELNFVVNQEVTQEALGINLPKVPTGFKMKIIVKKAALGDEFIGGRVLVDVVLSKNNIINKKEILIMGFDSYDQIFKSYFKNVQNNYQSNQRAILFRSLFENEISDTLLGIELPRTPKEIKREIIIENVDYFNGVLELEIKLSKGRFYASKSIKVNDCEFHVFGLDSSKGLKYMRDLNNYYKTFKKESTISQLDFKINQKVTQEDLGISLLEVPRGFEVELFIEKIDDSREFVDVKVSMVHPTVDYFSKIIKRIRVDGFSIYDKLFKGYFDGVRKDYRTTQVEFIENLHLEKNQEVDQKTLGITLPKTNQEFKIQLFVRKIIPVKLMDSLASIVWVELKVSQGNIFDTKTFMIYGFKSFKQVFGQYLDNLENSYQTTSQDISIKELNLKVDQKVQPEILKIKLPAAPKGFLVRLFVTKIGLDFIEVEVKISIHNYYDSKQIKIYGFQK